MLQLLLVPGPVEPDDGALDRAAVHDAELQAAARRQVAVVEPRHLDLTYPTLPVRDLDLHVVVVRRSVEERGRPDHRPGGLVAPADRRGRPVGPERAGLVARDGLLVPGRIGDEVDRAAQRVGAQRDRHHAAVHVDPVHEADRHVLDADPEAGQVDRDAVDEGADRLVVQPVQRQAGGRAEPAAAADLDALRPREHLAHVGGALSRRRRVDDGHRPRRLAQPLPLRLALDLDDLGGVQDGPIVVVDVAVAVGVERLGRVRLVGDRDAGGEREEERRGQERLHFTSPSWSGENAR